MKAPQKHVRLIDPPTERMPGMFIKHSNPATDPVVQGMNAYLDKLHAQGKTLMDVGKEKGTPTPNEDNSTANGA